MSIASTILEQLGGNKFKAMTGAKNFVDCQDRLMFKLPANFAKNGINKIVITLTPNDDYNVDFYKTYGTNCKLVHAVKSIYNDQLQEVFKDATGLDTHL